MYGQPIGYYVTCDDALCVPCFDAAGGEDGWNGRGGFEGWPEPIAIFDDTESDSCTHCCECGALIAHDLTDVGLSAVAEAIGEGFREGKQNPVTVQWMLGYGEQLDDVELPQAASADAGDVFDVYYLLPRDEVWCERDDLRKYARIAGWLDERTETN